MDNEDISDSFSTDSELESYDMDTFLSHHLDTLLDLFYDIKERFSYNPYFLEYLSSIKFVDFVIENAYFVFDLKDTNQYFIKNEKKYRSFLEDFSKELTLSYILIDKFLEDQEMPSIDTILFNKFCFMYSYVE